MTTGRASERKGLRFRAEQGTLVHIDLQEETAEFSPTIVGLAINEARNGCGAILLANSGIREGMTCTVKVGRLAPIRAEIKWVKELDSEVIKIGLLYLR